MSRQDPGAARGTTDYAPHRRCECGHLETNHLWVKGKDRTSCSSWHGGRCKCKQYVLEEE